MVSYNANNDYLITGSFLPSTKYLLSIFFGVCIFLRWDSTSLHLGKQALPDVLFQERK